jgi:uncharacterized beta-barrel protein YwiB (DUF1934 family)
MAMKDISLKIIGKQFVGEEAEDKVEFVTDGKMYEENGARFLVYKESELFGFPGCETTLSLKDGVLKMSRRGEAAGIGADIEFRKGARMTSLYETPFGDMTLEVLTEKVEDHLQEDGTGTINVSYRMSIEDVMEGLSELEIEVAGTKH